MKESIKQLFLEYEQAFATLHNENVAKFYADEFIAAGPQGSHVFPNDNAYYKWLEQAGKGYKQLGMHSGRIISMADVPYGDDYTMVTVHYGVQFLKTGDRVIEFDISYLVGTVGDDPKILLYISHKDEQKALQELGVL